MDAEARVSLMLLCPPSHLLRLAQSQQRSLSAMPCNRSEQSGSLCSFGRWQFFLRWFCSVSLLWSCLLFITTLFAVKTILLALRLNQGKRLNAADMQLSPTSNGILASLRMTRSRLLPTSISTSGLARGRAGPSARGGSHPPQSKTRPRRLTPPDRMLPPSAAARRSGSRV